MADKINADKIKRLIYRSSTFAAISQSHARTGRISSAAQKHLTMIGAANREHFHILGDMV